MVISTHRLRLLPITTEAAFCLTLAWMAIAFLPFARVARLAEGETSFARREADADAVAAVRRAIAAAARRLPFRTKCFECGLAAQWMLRRRGMAPSLFYGASLREGTDLSAHVWVRVGGLDVVGCENLSDFAVLACFPAATDSR